MDADAVEKEDLRTWYKMFPVSKVRQINVVEVSPEHDIISLFKIQTFSSPICEAVYGV